MKMAAVSTVTALLLCCSFFASADSTDSCHYAATNENFTVPLTHTLQKSERLSWKHNSKIIYDSRQNKESIVFANGSLLLTKVSKKDEGQYIPEVFATNGRAVQGLKGMRLCVIDRVQKPKIMMSCPGSNVKFTCDVKVRTNPRGSVVYFSSPVNRSTAAKDDQIGWFKNEKLLAGKKLKSVTLEAETVEMDSFRCEVSNKLGSSKSDAVIQNCYSSWFPEELFGINIWIFVGGGAGVVVLLILVVIFFCIHNRRKKRVQLKDEEELRLGWTNSNGQQQQQQQQHHHPHHQHNHPPHQHRHHPHHQQQQPAGHTGPRQPRKKQPHNPRPPAPNPNGQPEPSPRRQGLSLPKVPDSVDDEQPPPLPQPRKKGPKTQRV